MGLSLNRPAPTNGIAVFRKKKIPYEQALQLWRAKREHEATREQAAKPQGRRKGIAFFPRPSRSGLLLRDFSRLPLKESSRGEMGSHYDTVYPVELWNPCDFRRFLTTFRKCRNVRRSVSRRRLSTSEAILGDSLVKEPKIHFRIKLLH